MCASDQRIGGGSIDGRPARPSVLTLQHASKRARPNVGSALRRQPGPDYAKGVKYWEDIEATVDGVLGGFGTGVSLGGGVHLFTSVTH